ncbi:hypothetical protein EDB89DRAFT_2246023 [Lactarius sanguifluus]|nr:hypothetical protein EDB89DRAFT_2246023 [Lactarius sanguifluus]
MRACGGSNREQYRCRPELQRKSFSIRVARSRLHLHPAHFSRTAWPGPVVEPYPSMNSPASSDMCCQPMTTPRGATTAPEFSSDSAHLCPPELLQPTTTAAKPNLRASPTTMMDSDYEGGNYEDGDEDYGDYEASTKTTAHDHGARSSELHAEPDHDHAPWRLQQPQRRRHDDDSGSGGNRNDDIRRRRDDFEELGLLQRMHGDSLAMWRRKVAVPNSVRLSHLREIELAKAALQKDYPVLVDEIRYETRNEVNDHAHDCYHHN